MAQKKKNFLTVSTLGSGLAFSSDFLLLEKTPAPNETTMNFIDKMDRICNI